MDMIIYANEDENVLLEVSPIFKYEVDIQYNCKNCSEFSTFEFRSRFFLGTEEKVTKTFSDHIIIKTNTLIAAPEGWLQSNNFHKV